MLRTTIERIRNHEGYRATPYRDSRGIWTVGIGRNLEAVAFSSAEVDLMFRNDLKRAERDAQKLPEYESLSPERQDVLTEMTYQMGIQGVRRFRLMLRALRDRDYDEAAEQMLDSRWHEQTPARARRLARIMRSGHES